MSKRTYRATVYLDVRRDPTDLVALLDMLRYDAATVETWGFWDQSVKYVTLVADRPITLGRWASFGIRAHEGRVDEREG